MADTDSVSNTLTYPVQQHLLLAVLHTPPPPAYRAELASCLQVDSIVYTHRVMSVSVCNSLDDPPFSWQSSMATMPPPPCSWIEERTSPQATRSAAGIIIHTHTYTLMIAVCLSVSVCLPVVSRMVAPPCTRPRCAAAMPPSPSSWPEELTPPPGTRSVTYRPTHHIYSYIHTYIHTNMQPTYQSIQPI